MKVLSWNIWIDGYFDKITEFIKSANADNIALQEVTQEQDGKNNIAGEIADELRYNWVFDPTMQGEQHGKLVDWGKAILSRFPIVGHKTYVLSQEEKRTALEAIIQVNNSSLHVFSVHLLHTHQQDNDIQTLQVENLIKALPKDHVIAMGDFNATPNSSTIKIMQKVMTDTDSLSQPTWSVYPEGCESCKPQEINMRLDYIFVSKDIKVKSFEVGKSKGSDHLPILAVLE